MNRAVFWLTGGMQTAYPVTTAFINHKNSAGPFQPPQREESAFFTSWDGKRVFYRFWRPESPSNRALIFLHRGHEHSGRMLEAAGRLQRPDTWAFAWDARGHGRSPGKPGYADNFAVLVRDLDAFMRHLMSVHGMDPQQTVVVANSVAAVIAATWVHDYAPRIRGMVLVAPAFSIKLYVPFALQVLRWVRKFTNKAFVKSYVGAGMLTGDAKQAALYAADPLIRKEISVNVLVDLHDAAKRLIQDAFAIRVPALILSAGRDVVVRTRAQKAFFKNLGSKHKVFVDFPKLKHSLLHETDREKVFQEIETFLDLVFEEPTESTASAAQEHEQITAREFETLKKPLGALANLPFSIQQRMLGTVGHLSDGIRLGFSSGFDSGRMLNYVYENRSRGVLGLGRLIDRQYLDSVGWRGIRQRRNWLEQTLRATIRERLADGSAPVRILDIAAGPGRYVQEIMKEFAPGEVEALLCDYRMENLIEGQNLATSLGLSGIQFMEADAFDEDSIVKRGPAPDIIIASGIFELFPHNQDIQPALRGAMRALKPGGYLIYTCQPWHPQLEMIARVLPNREGNPWVMRRRTQLEMDWLVENVGFKKSQTCVDDFGIFTVSCARKETRR